QKMSTKFERLSVWSAHSTPLPGAADNADPHRENRSASALEWRQIVVDIYVIHVILSRARTEEGEQDRLFAQTGSDRCRAARGDQGTGRRAPLRAVPP